MRLYNIVLTLEQKKCRIPRFTSWLLIHLIPGNLWENSICSHKAVNPLLIVKITYCVTYSFICFPKDNKLQGASALPSHSSWRCSQCFSPNLNIRAHTMSSTRQADNMNKSKAKVTQNHVKRQRSWSEKFRKIRNRLKNVEMHRML